VLSGVGAAYAALRASDHPGADDDIGLVFAVGALIIALVRPVVVMANMRGLRAVVYVRNWLHPLATQLTDDWRYLAWESVAGPLYGAVTGRVAAGASGRRRPWWRAVVRWLPSTMPVALLIGAASLSLVVAACTIEHSMWSRWIAGAAAVSDVVFISMAFHFVRVIDFPRDPATFTQVEERLQANS
jgi:hypothetical protein